MKAKTELGYFSDAIEKQWELIRVWQSPQGERWASIINPGMVRADIKAKPDAIRRVMIEELQTAEPFYVTQEICNIVERTFDTLPDIQLLQTLIPVPTGWVYLEKSCEIGPESNIEPYSPLGKIPKLKAFSWGPHSIVKDGIEGAGVGFTVYEDGSPTPWPLEIIAWGFGINWGSDWRDALDFESTPIERDVSKQRSHNIRKYLLTLFSFLSQKIFMVSHQRATRGARKRYLQLSYEEPPLIKVIVLRAKKSVVPPAGEVRDINWAFRWIVRGHWRQQWYSSFKGHKAIWITPYVKGPEDKPLKNPKSNLFIVAR